MCRIYDTLRCNIEPDDNWIVEAALYAIAPYKIIAIPNTPSYRSNGGYADFVAGVLLRGALCGTLSYIFAPHIRRSLLNEDAYEFRRAKRPIYYDEGLEMLSQNQCSVPPELARHEGSKMKPGSISYRPPRRNNGFKKVGIYIHEVGRTSYGAPNFNSKQVAQSLQSVRTTVGH
ncbi:uncharacterized protein Tco_0366242 [Tanacetum coccineum]